MLFPLQVLITTEQRKVQGIMSNLLLEEVEYKVTETSLGTWRRYLYPTGMHFAEFRSHTTILGLPLIHYTEGKCPETGRRIIACGIVAVGRMAVGGVAIGHASAGVVAVGQLGLGLLFGLAQLSTGVVAIGQAGIGLAIGLGQLATGYIAVGQLAVGKYVLAQKGLGQYVIDTSGVDPVAKEFFLSLMPW